MIQAKKLTLIWLALGLIFSLLVMITVFTGLSGKVYVTEPEGIRNTAETLLEAVRTGSWDSLNETIMGQTSLAPALGEVGSAQQLIYEAYQESLQWTIQDDFVVQGPYITQKIMVSCLDIPQITREISRILEDIDVDSDTLRSAAETVLKGQPQTSVHELTLTFQRKDHQWRVVPNSALQSLLSGFITH